MMCKHKDPKQHDFKANTIRLGCQCVVCLGDISQMCSWQEHYLHKCDLGLPAYADLK